MLLDRGDRWKPTDIESRHTAAGTALDVIARDAHWGTLEQGPVGGELGYFFGASWPVEEQVVAVADEAIAHLLPQAGLVAVPGTAPPPIGAGPEELERWKEAGDRRRAAIEGVALADLLAQPELEPDAREVAVGIVHVEQRQTAGAEDD